MLNEIETNSIYTLGEGIYISRGMTLSNTLWPLFYGSYHRRLLSKFKLSFCLKVSWESLNTELHVYVPK